MMVFMGNVCNAHRELAEDEIIELRFDNDNIISICKEDELLKANGDLKIIKPDNNCSIFVDTAFVKYMIVKRRFL